jgi:integrase
VTAGKRRRRSPSPARPHSRTNGEGSSYPAQAAQAPVPTRVPTLGQYLNTWLSEVIKPNVEPATYAYYEAMSRLYIVPGLGSKRLDRLQIRDVQAWLNRLASACQCCAQGKDAARPEDRRRCCAIGACCQDYAELRTVQAARNILRAALDHARLSEELVSLNMASFVKVSTPPPRRGKDPAWNIAEASRFLASAREYDDPLYAAYVLVLVNGLSKAEVLGLTWADVGFPERELDISWQLQRVGKELIHKRVTTGDSGGSGTVPLPDICAAALQLRREEQDAACEQAGSRWHQTELVFTTRWGTPIEPRNFNRSFDARCAKAGVPRIRVHDTRRTCAWLLAALDVHPMVATAILRHAQIPISYAEIPRDATRAALKKLSDSLSGLPPVQRDLP